MKLSEKDFLIQVTQLAEIRGWAWLHLRPGMTRDSWRTPISGPLGKGWPDLLLIRNGEIMWLELKAEGGSVSPDQEQVIATLSEVGLARVYRPSDWDEIEQVLR